MFDKVLVQALLALHYVLGYRERQRCFEVKSHWQGWKASTCTNHSFDLEHAVGAHAEEIVGRHHAAYSHIGSPWVGSLFSGSAEAALGNVVVDFLGARYPGYLYCNKGYTWQLKAHAVRAMHCLLYVLSLDHRSRYGLDTVDFVLPLPMVSEEYFEYISIIRAVLDFVEDTAHDSQAITDGPRRERFARPFVFVEIGAGYGHWFVAAHRILERVLAWRGIRESPVHRYLLVDVVDMAAEAAQLADMNGISKSGAGGTLAFHTGFVTGTGAFETRGFDAGAGDVKSETSAAYAAEIRTRYAQRYESSKDEAASRRSPGGTSDQADGHTLKAPDAVSLERLLRDYDMPCFIDMIDVDIQGGEYSLFSAPDTLALLTQRVRRLHVGLHTADFKHDVDLAEAFRRYGWRVEWFWHRAAGTEDVASTAWGSVFFGDGILAVVNDRLPPSLSVDCGVR